MAGRAPTARVSQPACASPFGLHSKRREFCDAQLPISLRGRCCGSADRNHVIASLESIGVRFLVRKVFAVRWAVGVVVLRAVFRWLIDAARLNSLVVAVFGFFALLLASFGDVLFHRLAGVVSGNLCCGAISRHLL